MALTRKIAAATLALGLATSAGSGNALSADLASKPNNLAQYGIPPLETLTKPLATKYADHSPAIPGNETQLDFYRSDGRLVVLWSIRGKPNSVYFIGLDYDWKAPPTDVSLIDRHGQGHFEPHPADTPLYAPDWAVKQ